MARSILKVLSDEEVQRIHETSLKILQEFGAKIDDEDLRNDLLSKRMCSV